MSTKFYVIAVWTLLSFVVKVNAQDKVECWDRFELSFKQVTKGNPFDTRLSATFGCHRVKRKRGCLKMKQPLFLFIRRDRIIIFCFLNHYESIF